MERSSSETIEGRISTWQRYVDETSERLKTHLLEEHIGEARGKPSTSCHDCIALTSDLRMHRYEVQYWENRKKERDKAV